MLSCLCRDRKNWRFRNLVQLGSAALWPGGPAAGPAAPMTCIATQPYLIPQGCAAVGIEQGRILHPSSSKSLLHVRHRLSLNAELPAHLPLIAHSRLAGDVHTNSPQPGRLAHGL